MTIAWKKIVGALFLILLVSGIVYIAFGQEVKIRIDYDKTTIYVFENSRWIVGGREYNRLFDGTSRMYRSLSGLSIETTLGNNSVTIKRTTPYIRGPTIVDTYYFEGNITDKKMFPIYHTVEIYNGSGFFYRYEVRDLFYDGETRKLDVNYMEFEKDISVEWDTGYRWAWVYKTGILKVQYDIPTDYEIYNVRLFDPPGDITACTDLNAPGVYTLTTDITNSVTEKCMNFTANDVILDCQGNTIDSDGNAGYGIYIKRSSINSTNITVRNCVLTDWGLRSILLENACNNTLDNLTILDSDSFGILFAASNENNLTNIISNSAGDSGIYFESGSNYNNLINMTLNYNSEGIFFESSSNNTMININASSNSGSGLEITQSSSDNNMTNITANDNRWGLSFTSSVSNNILANSTIQNNTDYGFYIYADIGGTNYFYNNFINNTVNVYFSTGAFYSGHWNTTNQTGTRIYSDGTNIGGNYWTNSTGDFFSDTCVDADTDGFCDLGFNVTNSVECTIGVNCSATNADFLPYSDEYIEPQPPTLLILYLNGSANNRSYELGTVANLSVHGGGTICIGINASGYNSSYSCGTYSTEFMFKTFATETKFNDLTTSKNLTANTTVNVKFNNESVKLINATWNLTGYESTLSWMHDNWYSDVSNEETGPTGVYHNGTHFWIVGYDSKRVYRYLANGSYDNWNFDVSNEDSTPTGVYYNGTHFWVIGTGSDSVYRYTSAGVYDNWNFDVSGEATAPQGIYYNGTYFWVVNNGISGNGRAVSRYNSTGDYDDWYFAVDSQDGSPKGVIFDGTYFWIPGDNTNKVYRYTSAGTYDDWSTDVSLEDSNPMDITYNGGYFWIVGDENNKVYRYLNYSLPKDVKIDIGNNGNIDFELPGLINGTKSYISELNNGETTEDINYNIPGVQLKYFRLPKNVSITSAKMNLSGSLSDVSGNYTGEYLNVINQIPYNARGVVTNNTFIWVADADIFIFKYFMNGTYTGDYWTPTSGNSEPYGIEQNGTFFWVADLYDELIYVYNMDGTYTGTSWSVENADALGGPKGIATNNTHIWVIADTFVSPGDYSVIDKYDMQGNYIDSINTSLSDCSNMVGITVSNDRLWVIQLNGDICELYLNGTFIERTIGTVTFARGIDNNGEYFWVSKSRQQESIQRVYKYWMQLYPFNVSVDTGNDGTIDWSFGGELNTSNSPQEVDLNVTALQNFIDSSDCEYPACDMVFIVGTETPATIEISEIDIQYTFNPINLNISAINVSLITVPFGVTAEQWGTLQTDNLEFNYYGSIQYNVTAYNSTDSTTLYLDVKWSNYSITLPRLVDYPFFAPLTNESKNVTPFGQDDDTPIYNISSVAYDQPFDFYIRVNETFDTCFNLTMSNTSNVSDGISLNTTYQKILFNCPILSDCSGIWIWRDYNCNTTFRYYEYIYEYYSKCTTCV